MMYILVYVPWGKLCEPFGDPLYHHAYRQLHISIVWGRKLPKRSREMLVVLCIPVEKTHENELVVMENASWMNVDYIDTF